MADQPARLAPGELGDVGVLLLRQHRAARGVGVVEADEAELLGRPQHELLAEPREVHARAAPGRRAPRRRSRGRDTASSEFSKRLGEAELVGDRVGVERQRGARRARRPRAGATSRRTTREQQPVDVAGERPAVGEEVVGEQDRLGPLQVGVAGQVGVARLGGPVQRASPGARAPPRHAPGARGACRAAGRWRPGRCGSGRCAAWRRRRRRSRSPGARSRCGCPRRPAWKTKLPASSSSSTRSSAASRIGDLLVVEDPGAGQAAHVGRDPGRSSAARRRSKARLAVKAMTSSAVPPSRPAQRVTAGPTVGSSGCSATLAGRPGGTPRPPERTKPSASAWSEGVRRVVGGEPVVVERRRAAPPDDHAAARGEATAAPRR